MEKDELLKLLLEKGIITKIEDFDDLTKPQLEKLLECGMALIAESINTTDANNAAIEKIVNSYAEGDDDFKKNLAIENKRLKQERSLFVEACRAKIKELAKLLN